MGDKLALVTGGAGFIGSTIARALLKEGTPVRVFDNLVSGFLEVVPEGAEFQLGDLRDAEAIAKACEGVDVVYHQAALRSVARSVDEPLVTEENNVMGTLNLLGAAEAAGVRRVVYAASSSAYGETTEGVNREDSLPNPLSPYAVSKLTGEYYCRVWTHLKGLSTVSLRYFNVFGPGQHPESKYAAVFPGFISALAAGRAPEVHWDGEQSRDFTYVGDVARANMLAASADGRVDGQVINIGAGRAKTVNEVLATVSKAIGTWIEPVRTPKRQGDVRATLADITRARELLGWEPQADWDGAVAATVRWFLEGAPGKSGKE
jgi:UDP-N-acetylglucosamine/UDP-N-acetylgalactosamine 4-epimerase